ncbi:division/cell wall cluster transcriptional repressor MraZ [Vulgatibacter incomptus]|uniref:Transcriptional regulator MraZ n=1 Tax=Vulgatibacter incomptus TaxID=1391653 RepID=A0A0K1PEA8_9BACT|nr:division/cell wall cluster transcriptional repressor MraZ [Vulgatibacter incomptus]AKU91873.1 Cell division protein MraZ [Vulgatibacter incomptus]
MFRGTFEHAIDAKGRTSLPAKFREVLAAKYGGAEGQTLVVAPSPLDPCLRAYPMEEWQAVEETLAARGNFDPKLNTLLRLFVGGAHETPVDKLGRMLMAPSLREHGSLTKDVAFVGSLKFIEIWDAEAYRVWKLKQREQVENLARALGDLGL